jgi:hypothetical protein
MKKTVEVKQNFMVGQMNVPQGAYFQYIGKNHYQWLEDLWSPNKVIISQLYIDTHPELFITQ